MSILICKLPVVVAMDANEKMLASSADVSYPDSNPDAT